jgi:hypothetical protein
MISETEVVIKNNMDELQIIEAESIVLPSGAKPNNRV